MNLIKDLLVVILIFYFIGIDCNDINLDSDNITNNTDDNTIKTDDNKLLYLFTVFTLATIATLLYFTYSSPDIELVNALNQSLELNKQLLETNKQLLENIKVNDSIFYKTIDGINDILDN